MDISGAVKNIEIPQALRNIDLPNAVKNLELPQAVKNIELPSVVKNLDIPQAVKNLNLQETVRHIEIPNAVKNIELPQAVKNIEIPNALRGVPNAVTSAVKDVQIPDNATTRRLSLFASSAFTSVASLTHMIQQKVEETTKSIQQEHQVFIKQVKEESIEPNIGTVSVTPWEGLPNEDELREKMLALSKDKRNFLINPPENTNFQFDMNIYYQTAMAVLNADPNLNRMRFELVPSQVQEPTFWRNYFYRISLIKQTALGSIDAVVLQNEVYSKGEDEVGQENADIPADGKSGEKHKLIKSEDVKEVLFDAEKIDDNTDGWMQDELEKSGQEGDADEEIVEDWEEQMKKELLSSAEK